MNARMACCFLPRVFRGRREKRENPPGRREESCKNTRAAAGERQKKRPRGLPSGSAWRPEALSGIFGAKERTLTIKISALAWRTLRDSNP